MMYFDNAATTWPKPRSVGKAMFQALGQYGGNPGRGGHTMAMKTSQMIYETRKTACELFSMDKPENVVFTQNCSHALNLVIYGALNKGDRVVISDLEHNSVLRPLFDLKVKGSIEIEIAKTSLSDPAETVKNFADLIDSKTKLVICTHASNVTGTVLPVGEIGRLAHSYGALFAVDAAQTAGMLPIDVTKMEIDFLCMPGHKGLYGPTGTGMLLINCEELLEPQLKGGTGSLSARINMPDFYPDRLECGTLNVCGICGLKGGMDFLKKTGIERIHRYEHELLSILYSGLSECNGVELYTQFPKYDASVPVVCFNIRGKTGEETARILDEKGIALRGGLHCAPSAHKKIGTLERGTVRISLGAFNTADEIYRFCETIKKLRDSV